MIGSLFLFILGVMNLRVYSENSDYNNKFITNIGNEVQESENICDKIPDGLIKLPRDDSLHENLKEWWFYIGSMKDEQGKLFEFLAVVFKLYSAGTPFLSGESAFYIDGKILYKSSVAFIQPEKVKDGFRFDLGHVKLEGSNGEDSIHISAGDYSMDLQVTQVKAPVLHHKTGYIQTYFGADTYYYTRPYSNATGVLTKGNFTYEVTGNTYFDHQYGHLDGYLKQGWDWFMIHLEDGVEIIITLVKPEENEVLIVDANCNSIFVDPQDIKVNVLSKWMSPTTGCSYPYGWEFIIKGKKYILTPTMEDQEILQPRGIRWEGVFNVSGDAVGRGVAELVGYC